MIQPGVPGTVPRTRVRVRLHTRSWFHGARRSIALLLVAIAVGACADGTASPPPAVTDPPGSPVVGVVIRLRTEGLAAVRGFDLRLDDGRILPFTLGRLENVTEFPPGHLPEHMAAADRLLVTFDVNGGVLVVHRMEHADP